MSAGSVATLKTYPVLPLRTYDKFDVDPMFVVANAFSKLRKIGEGAALQIVLPGRQFFRQENQKDRRRDKKRGETFRSLEKAKITGTGVFLSSAI